MTIYENRGARQQARIHAHPFAGINLDGHETLPLVAAALGRGSQLAKEILLELDDFLDIHADQQRFSGGDAAFNHKNVLELIVPGGEECLRAYLFLTDQANAKLTDARRSEPYPFPPWIGPA